MPSRVAWARAEAENALPFPPSLSTTMMMILTTARQHVHAGGDVARQDCAVAVRGCDVAGEVDHPSGSPWPTLRLSPTSSPRRSSSTFILPRYLAHGSTQGNSVRPSSRLPDSPPLASPQSSIRLVASSSELHPKLHPQAVSTSVFPLPPLSVSGEKYPQLRRTKQSDCASFAGAQPRIRLSLALNSRIIDSHPRTLRFKICKDAANTCESRLSSCASQATRFRVGCGGAWWIDRCSSLLGTSLASRNQFPGRHARLIAHRAHEKMGSSIPHRDLCRWRSARPGSP